MSLHMQLIVIVSAGKSVTLYSLAIYCYKCVSCICGLSMSNWVWQCSVYRMSASSQWMVFEQWISLDGVDRSTLILVDGMDNEKWLAFGRKWLIVCQVVYRSFRIYLQIYTVYHLFKSFVQQTAAMCLIFVNIILYFQKKNNCFLITLFFCDQNSNTRDTSTITSSYSFMISDADISKDESLKYF